MADAVVVAAGPIEEIVTHVGAAMIGLVPSVVVLPFSGSVGVDETGDALVAQTMDASRMLHAWQATTVLSRVARRATDLRTAAADWEAVDASLG